MVTREDQASEAATAVPALDSIEIRGFRSLADVKLEALPNVTVLIGPNGSGKSNLFRFFEMCSWMLRSGKLAEFVARQGGADDQLFRGRAVTPQIEAKLSMRTEAGRNDYRFSLTWTQDDQLVFTEESFRAVLDDPGGDPAWHELGGGHRAARLAEAAQGRFDGADAAAARTILHLLRDCTIYQFHDTSDYSRFKQLWDIGDCAQLRSDGANLAPVLLRLEREDVHRYDLICYQIARMVPNFERFAITEQYGKAMLRWKASGSEKTYGAHLTSDGSLRFFALVTLFYLPDEMLPKMVLLDEPELGLHPAAVELIGHLIDRMGMDRQVIVATQSSALVSVFNLEQLIVLDLDDGQTTCRQFEADEYREWLDDGYTTGYLWNTNLLEGNP